MAQFETWLTRDLSAPNCVQALDHVFFVGDNNGNMIRVKLLKNGEPYPIGSVEIQGIVIKGDGTMAETQLGGISGDSVWVSLDEDCLDTPGKIQISIRVVKGNQKTVLASCTAMVVRTDTADDISETIDYSGIDSGDSQDIEVIEFIDDP